jgi:hypothetical protein
MSTGLAALGGVLGGDQHDPVAEPVEPGAFPHERLVGEIFHPVEIGRNEDIRWRAALDLLGERRTCGVGNGDLPATQCSPRLVGVVERVLHAGCCKDGDFFLRCGGSRKRGDRHEGGCHRPHREPDPGMPINVHDFLSDP